MTQKFLLRNEKTRKSQELDDMENSVTFNGLSRWYRDTFEKFAWTLLAHRDKRPAIVKGYLDGLGQLRRALEHKAKKIRDADKRDDLLVMRANLAVLEEHAAAALRLPRMSKPTR